MKFFSIFEIYNFFVFTTEDSMCEILHSPDLLHSKWFIVIFLEILKLTKMQKIGGYTLFIFLTNRELYKGTTMPYSNFHSRWNIRKGHVEIEPSLNSLSFRWEFKFWMYVFLSLKR